MVRPPQRRRPRPVRVRSAPRVPQRQGGEAGGRGAAAGAAAAGAAAAGAAAALGGLVGRFLADSFGRSPWSIKNARAVSEGRAPFCSQTLILSRSRLSFTGSVIGS